MTAEYVASELIAWLGRLPPDAHPIRICLYWRDIQLGRHLPFLAAGFPCVTAGHMYDKEFLLRVIRLLAAHQFAASNDLGSSSLFAAALGMPVTLLRHSVRPRSPDQRLLADIKPPDHPLALRFIDAGQAWPGDGQQQRQIADELLGGAAVRSPEALRELMVRGWREARAAGVLDEIFRGRREPVSLAQALRNIATELEREVGHLPDDVPGKLPVGGRELAYAELRRLVREAATIFRDNLYDFRPASDAPVIVDVGADVGLAALYFADKLPQARIECLEPDAQRAEMLAANLRTFGVKNARVFTTGGAPAWLRERLEQGPVDLLRVDLGGAELEAVRTCGALLTRAHHLIIEAHQRAGHPARLGELLSVLEQSGFAATLGGIRPGPSGDGQPKTPFAACASDSGVVTVLAWPARGLRVLQISDHQLKGSAAAAAHRLHRGLRRRATVEPELVSLNAPSDPTLPGRDWLQAFRELGCTLDPARVGPDAASAWRAVIAGVADAARPDVFSVHNVHEAVHDAGVPLDFLELLAARAPVVVTMHDMWWMTARCGYVDDCRQYESGSCGESCPTAGVHPKLPGYQIAERLRWKRDFCARQRDRLVFVSPSRWLAAQARKTFLSANRIEVIPYGVDLELFRPNPGRGEARAALGLHASELTVLVAAADLADRRKGTHLLWEALPRISAPMTVLLLGKDAPPVAAPAAVRVVPVGFVADPAVLAQLYGAADLVVSPALADNLPNMLLESIACGTPCVGFSVGGVPDIVRPGLTGWLAPETSSAALGRVLDDLAHTPAATTALRETCRAVAEREYGLDLQARRYEALFRELAAPASAPSPARSTSTISAGMRFGRR